MYNAEYTREFYNVYAEAEWSRLETNTYGRLQAIIHEGFIQRYIKPGDRVLDAGSGPGRFSISAANLGSKVTVLDISDKQLELAKQKISEVNLLDNIEQFIRADITDLSIFPDCCFDSTICFGGALSYVCEKRHQAAEEIIRVTRPGGVILVSIMSRLKTALFVAQQDASILKNTNKTSTKNPDLWLVLESGDFPGFHSRRANMMHPPMHVYTAEELQNLFKECQVIEIAGSNVTTSEVSSFTDEITKDPYTWEVLVQLEQKINQDPGLLNSGSHIILATRK
jgi:ubiquinone/menaquinone biosynthesis C-methylase UbiE